MDSKKSYRPETESQYGGHQSKNAPSPKQQSLWARIRSSDWWIQVQFWVLLVSILANVVLFFWTQVLQSNIRQATFNDKAWEAISKYTKDYNNENKKTMEVLSVLLSESPRSEGWIERVDSALSDWTNNTRQNALELRSKIENYNLVLNRRLEAFEVARSRVTNIDTPFSALITAIDARINERRIHLETNPEVARSRGGGYIRAGNEELRKINDRTKVMIENSLKSVRNSWG